MKYHKKLIFSLIISDFLVYKKEGKNLIGFSQQGNVLVSSLMSSLKLFSRLIRFIKNLGDGISIFMNDVFYMDLLKNICFFAFQKKFKTKLLKRITFSSDQIRLDNFIFTNSLYLLSLSTFLNLDFRSFWLKCNTLLFFSLGFLNHFFLPVRIYSLLHSIDDLKQIIFLGIFLVKNLQPRYKKRLYLHDI